MGGSGEGRGGVGCGAGRAGVSWVGRAARAWRRRAAARKGCARGAAPRTSVTQGSARHSLCSPGVGWKLGLHWGQRAGVQGSALRETRAAEQGPLKFSGEKKETSSSFLGDFSPAAPFRLPHAPPSRHAYHFQWAYAAQHAAQDVADDRATRKQDFVFWRVRPLLRRRLASQVRVLPLKFALFSQPSCRPRPLKASPSAPGPSTAQLPSMGAFFIALAFRAREPGPERGCFATHGGVYIST